MKVSKGFNRCFGLLNRSLKVADGKLADIVIVLDKMIVDIRKASKEMEVKRDKIKDAIDKEEQTINAAKAALQNEVALEAQK